MSKVIGATLIEKVYESKLRENYVVLLGELAPKPVPDLVRGVEEFFAKQPDEKLSQCDICKGWSDANATPACPYCDDSDGAPSALAPNEIPEPATEVVPDDVEIDATQIEASGVSLEPAPEPEKKGRKKLAPAEVADKKKVRAAPPTPKPSAPVIPISTGLALAGGRALASEKDLDESIRRFKEAGTAGAAADYVMGQELSRMRDTLWQQRTDGNGKPKYKSFLQFVAEEVEISKALAYRMMRVASVFTRDQFVKFGPSALGVLVGAPHKEHQQLMERAEAGATVRELEDEVRQIREKQGITVLETTRPKGEASSSPKRGPSPAATAAAAAARRKESAAITLGLKAEQTTVVMKARAKRGEPEREAKTIEDQPYGVIECINGVDLYIAVKLNARGVIEAKVTARRQKDEDDGEE